jgi:PAS domain S-box-containing protein
LNKFYDLLVDFIEKLDKEINLSALKSQENEINGKILFTFELLKSMLEETGNNIEKGFHNDQFQNLNINIRKFPSNYFQKIIENTPSVISVFDNKLNLEYINSAHQKISGFSNDEIIHQNVLQYIHPEDHKTLALSLRKVYQNGHSQAEYRMRCKDGTYVWLEGYGTLINKGTNKKFVLSANEITERKRLQQFNAQILKKLKKSKKKLRKLNKSLETKVSERTAKLREVEKRYNIITDYASDIILIFNINIEFEYINENALSKILGYKRKDLLYKRRLDLMHPEDLIKLKEFSHEFSKYGRNTIELRIKHKNGTYIWVEAKGKKFKDKEGNEKAMMIIRDISDHKKVQRELERVNKIKTEFLRRVSHELKTPLISIKGNTDLIMQNYSNQLNDEMKTLLNEVQKGSKRLEKFIFELLEASQLESGEVEVHLRRENLNFLVQYVINNLKWLIKSRNHEIVLDLQENVIADFEKERIYDVINNLLTNAIKFTPPGGKIFICTRKEENMVEFSIKDTGIGFTKEEKVKAFKKFGKIERYGQGFDLKINGSGLGLYIAKKIIELHDGRIWVESEGRNQGSTFFFSLPIRS